MARRSVLVWGCYWQGNFGDDLMALAFGRMLAQANRRPIIFGLPGRLARAYGMESTSNLADGYERADAVLLGGGAFFKTPAARAGSHERRIRTVLSELAAIASGQEKPIYCASVGSDGADCVEALDAPRRRIVCSRQFKGGLVRLKKDLNLGLPNLTYADDILSATPVILERLFPEFLATPDASVTGESAEDELLSGRVGLNFSKKNFLARAYQLAGLLVSRNVVFIRSHDPSSGIRSEVWIPGLKRFDNVDPVQTAVAIGRLSLIVSSKLHLGLVAASLGVPFVSLQGNAKTREYFRENQELVSPAAMGPSISFAGQYDRQRRLYEAYRCFIDAI